MKKIYISGPINGNENYMQRFAEIEHGSSGRGVSVTAKEYLLQLEILQHKIEQKRKRAAELRGLALGFGGFDYSKDRVKTSINGGKLENDVMRYITLETEIEEESYEYQKKKDEIIRKIHSLDNANFIKILYKRYVEFESLKRVSAEMMYSYSYIKHMHGVALKSFEERLKMTPNNTF